MLLFITAWMIAETLGEQLTQPGPYFAKSPWQLKSMQALEIPQFSPHYVFFTLWGAKRKKGEEKDTEGLMSICHGGRSEWTGCTLGDTGNIYKVKCLQCVCVSARMNS